VEINPNKFSVFLQVVLIQKLSYGILIHKMNSVEDKRWLNKILGTISMMFLTISIIIMIVFLKDRNHTLFKKFKKMGSI
jgi:hypothetical protein